MGRVAKKQEVTKEGDEGGGRESEAASSLASLLFRGR